MRILSSIIMVAVISLLCISPSLARNNSLQGIQENWNRRTDNIRDRRHDRQEQRQERWNDRREQQRDQWNNMRHSIQDNFNRDGGRRGGKHRGRGHH